MMFNFQGFTNIVSITPWLQLHVLLCFGRINSKTLARKPGEIESPHLLTVKRQLAAGCWLLAEVPVTAENDRGTAITSTLEW